MLMQSSNHIRQASRVIGLKIDRRIAPNLSEAGDVIGDNGASGESSFKRRHTKSLISRGRRVDRGAAVQRAKLRLRLRPSYRHGDLVDGKFHVGADRNLAIGNLCLRSHDANRKWV